jgi:hypothetical protein
MCSTRCVSTETIRGVRDRLEPLRISYGAGSEYAAHVIDVRAQAFQPLESSPREGLPPIGKPSPARTIRQSTPKSGKRFISKMS